MKRRTGLVLMETGMVLIILALSLFLYNKREADRAQKAAGEIEELLSEEIEDSNWDVDSGDGDMPVIEIDGYEYIGLLSIQRFGLTLPVMVEWSYPGLKIAPGRYGGSVWTDDLIICGHNYERHFGQLKNLDPGDSIDFTDVNGNVFSYEVEKTEILEPTAVEELADQGEDEWDLTLFTCTLGGQARVTVRCAKIE